jgi:uncharacterized protein (TIGR01244 family)
MGIEDACNFRRIHERLTTSGFVTAQQLSDLGRDGYEAVINLLPDDHDRALADEAVILREQGVDYVHIPVDFDAPTRADLDAFVAAMDARVGQKIHVHCAANYRVSAFYGLYALRRGLDGDTDAGRFDAGEFVGGIWDPSEFPVWKAFIADQRAFIADR